MSKGKILIIEDDRDMIDTVAFMLRAHNFLVHSAQGGQEGLEKAKNERPDLILLDLGLPDISGYEVCTKLKSDRSTKNIPIVIFTAHGDSKTVTRCHGLGVSDFIVKPFSLPTLLGKLKKFLGKKEFGGFTLSRRF